MFSQASANIISPSVPKPHDNQQEKNPSAPFAPDGVTGLQSNEQSQRHRDINESESRHSRARHNLLQILSLFEIPSQQKKYGKGQDGQRESLIVRRKMKTKNQTYCQQLT